MQPNQNCFSRGRYPLGSRTKTALSEAIAIGALLGTLLQPASSATEVRGQLNSMHVRAENAPIREVLDALAATFKLTYLLPSNIGRVVSGLYSGSLYEILARVLDGNDYIIKISDNQIEIAVLGASATPNLASGNQPVVAQENHSVAPVAAVQSPPPLSSFLSVNVPTAPHQGNAAR